MTDRTMSRRGALKIGGTVSLATLAGCSSPLSDDTEGETGVSTVIPAGANFIGDVDVETVLGDDVIREQYDSALAEMSPEFGQQLSISQFLDGIESEFGLDPEEINELLLYADIEGEQSAVIAAAEWSEDQVGSALPAEEGSHNGQSLYQSEELAIGVLPDGRYVIGPSESTRNVIDVRQGDTAGVDGEIITAFDSAPDGFVRFAFVPPDDFTPSSEGSFDLSSVGEISYGYGGLYQNAQTTGGEVVVETTSSDAATEIKQATTGALGMGTRSLGEEESVPEEIVTVLDSTDVSQSGTTVRLENDDGRGYLLLIPLAIISSFILGLGDTASETTPRLNFSSEYDPESSTLTVMMVAGDTQNRAGQVIVRGDTPDSGSRWHELTDASPETPDEPISAGDTATIEGVDEGDEIRLVYETDSTSRILLIREI